MTVNVNKEKSAIIEYLSSPDRGVVSRSQECEKSRGVSLIDSEMAGPISMKLSGIDQDNSVTVLGKKNRDRMTQES